MKVVSLSDTKLLCSFMFNQKGFCIYYLIFKLRAQTVLAAVFLLLPIRFFLHSLGFGKEPTSIIY